MGQPTKVALIRHPARVTRDAGSSNGPELDSASGGMTTGVAASSNSIASPSSSRKGEALSGMTGEDNTMIWVVDVIAPFGNPDVFLQDLEQTALKGKAFRVRVTSQDGKVQG